MNKFYIKISLLFFFLFFLKISICAQTFNIKHPTCSGCKDGAVEAFWTYGRSIVRVRLFDASNKVIRTENRSPYEFQRLPVGTYRLSFESQGRRGWTVRENKTFTLVVLNAGEVCSQGSDQIWEEDFEGVNQGWILIASQWKKNHPGEGQFAVGNLNGGGKGFIASFLDDNKTNNGEEYGTWESNPIDISNFSDVKAKLEVGSWEEGNGLEDVDFVKSFYSVDGGPDIPFQINGQLIDDIDPAVSVCTNIPDGSTLVLKIQMRNTMDDEFYFIDNVIVSGTQKTSVTPPQITATGDKNYCVGDDDKVKIVKTLEISNLVHLDMVSIQISDGTYIKGEDKLTCNTSSIPNVSVKEWREDIGMLILEGNATVSEYEKAIKKVKYQNLKTNPSVGPRKFTITLKDVNYLGNTNHFYKFIAQDGIRWTDARNAAEASSYFGMKGYLATITSQEEADFAGAQIAGAGWIGASDASDEGEWKWVTGPESGTLFWTGGRPGNGGHVVTGAYANWNKTTNEPNDAGNEDYAHINATGTGDPNSWNDLRNGGGTGPYRPKGYIVEYGGRSGELIPMVSATTTINVGVKPRPIGIFFE